MSLVLQSHDPASGALVWEGPVADAAECARATEAAHAAQPGWAETPLEHRISIARAFAELVKAELEDIAIAISRETGKPLWETRTEAAGLAGKVEVSIAAQAERAGERAAGVAFGRSVLRHRPHGVLAVLGPFNFPAHLPTGHIVPALLAGNAVLFKPSEQTPGVGALLGTLWARAGLPDGVLHVLQGGRSTGEALLAQAIDGLLFTGSARAGLHFQQQFAARPGFLMALELGGNNPLIAWDGEPQTAATIIAQSAFLSAGQRCSCARRLIVPEGAAGDAIVEATVALARRLRIGPWDGQPQPYMGCLISADAADAAERGFADMMARGGLPLLSPVRPGPTRAFISPGIIDMSGAQRRDEEIFGPLLQIVRVADFEAAVREANDTAYGLSAALISEDDALWETFLARARAGVVNRNRPTNGASADMPFGGLGASGNHRPSAYYAADYCAYPVASMEAPKLETMLPGMAAYLEENA